MYLCVYVRVCMHVCMHSCVCMYVYMYACLYVCMYECVVMYIWGGFVCLCVCARPRVYACVTAMMAHNSKCITHISALKNKRSSGYLARAEVWLQNKVGG